MDGALYDNDISHVVEADRAHVWHHLIQHKPFETNDQLRPEFWNLVFETF